MEEELWPLFGGYHGYQAAPVTVARRHQLRWKAKRMVESERAKEQAEKDAEIQRQYNDK